MGSPVRFPGGVLDTRISGEAGSYTGLLHGLPLRRAHHQDQCERAGRIQGIAAVQISVRSASRRDSLRGNLIFCRMGSWLARAASDLLRSKATRRVMAVRRLAGVGSALRPPVGAPQAAGP